MHRLATQRTLVVGLHLGEHVGLALGFVNRDGISSLKRGQRQYATRALIQQVKDLPIQLIDSNSPIGKIHEITFTARP
jgi:hypothetical protein